MNTAGHCTFGVPIPLTRAMACLTQLYCTKLSPVYGRLLHKLMADSYVSIDKARERLGFNPRLSNQDAILKTFQWWREERAAGNLRGGSGRTSRDPWRQGVLGLAKAFF